MAEIKFSRVWAMPNSATFTIKPIKEMVERNIAGKEVILDPFARECKYGTITNDLNPDFKTDYHLDALDFLKMFPDNYADCVIYDPPYSLRQVSECYKGVGRELTMETTQSSWRARHLDEIARILKPNGVALCFGWNSNGVGKTRGFEMQEVLIVPHGGSKNDTICTAERKVDVGQKENDMAEQLALFDVSDTKTKATINEKKKRNWENGFQRWSDNQSISSDGKSFGCCGWGSMCNYCEDNSYGRPCVRALNEMCREKKIVIDYDNRNYEDIWRGGFGRE